MEKRGKIKRKLIAKKVMKESLPPKGFLFFVFRNECLCKLAMHKIFIFNFCEKMDLSQ